MTTIYRQGDVLVRRIDDVPRRLKLVARRAGRLVLAEGEATGHAHVIDAPPPEATLLTDSERRTFLRLVTDAPLVHEEHATVRLPRRTMRGGALRHTVAWTFRRCAPHYLPAVQT